MLFRHFFGRSVMERPSCDKGPIAASVQHYARSSPTSFACRVHLCRLHQDGPAALLLVLVSGTFADITVASHGWYDAVASACAVLTVLCVALSHISRWCGPEHRSHLGLLAGHAAARCRNWRHQKHAPVCINRSLRSATVICWALGHWLAAWW